MDTLNVSDIRWSRIVCDALYVFRAMLMFTLRLGVYNSICLLLFLVTRILLKRICKASGTVSKVFRWYSLWHAIHTHNRAHPIRTTIDNNSIMIMRPPKRLTQTILMLKIIKIDHHDRARSLASNEKIINWPSKTEQAHCRLSFHSNNFLFSFAESRIYWNESFNVAF